MTMQSDDLLLKQLARIQTDLILMARRIENLRNPDYVPPGDRVVYIVDAKKGLAGKERETKDVLAQLEQDVASLGWSVSGIEYAVNGLRHYRKIAELPVLGGEMLPQAQAFIKRLKEDEND
jgi:hypothetical protein